MVALDFFCGAGGLTRGLLDAGIKVIAGFDNDPACQQTYEYNNPEARFIQRDIRDISDQDIKKIIRRKNFKNVLFAGCAPCQPFSQQRKGNASKHDATLLGEFGRLINSGLPGQVLVENVPGIAKVYGNSTFNRFLRLLKKCGYEYVFHVLNAKNYGVPQNRRRLILIAMHGVKPSFPEARFGNHLLPFKTVHDAIYHFPSINAGEADSDIPNHVAAKITDNNLKRLSYTPKDGGDRRSWPSSLRLNCHKGSYSGHTDVYGRMAWKQPAPALTGRCNSISNGRYGHPEQNRAISLREAAAIQSFPDRYVFFGSNKKIALQIGNAVPVVLAETLGRHILQLAKEQVNHQVY